MASRVELPTIPLGYRAPDVIAAPVQQVVVIQASGWWPGLRLPELWAYRSLLFFLVWRDLKVRYAQTVFGAGWAMLQPALTMLVFTVIFGIFAGMPSDGVPFSLFALSALVPWLYYGGGQQMLTQHRRETLDLNSIVCGSGPSEFFAHSHKPIRSVEDLKGMKFRTLGNWAAILRDGFGAAPVVVPGPELYSMLEKKAIDAMEYSMPSENRALGYQDIARYIIMPGIHAGAWTFELVMKTEKWDALPADIRTKIETAAKLTTYQSMQTIIVKDFAALEELKKGKNEFIVLDDTFKAKARDAARKWATEAAAKAKAEGNLWPEKVITSMFAFQDRWQRNSPYLVVDHKPQ